MRLLFLTCHLPYPPLSGGRRREFELLTRLATQHEIVLCSISKTYADDRRQMDALRPYCRRIELWEADRSVAGEPVASVAPGPLVPDHVRRHAAARAGGAVRRLVGECEVDVVHVEGYYLMQHVAPDCPVPTLLVEQNVEYLLYQQRLKLADTPEQRAQMTRQYRLTREWERRAWRQASRCAAVTTVDRRVIMALEPELDVALVPNGTDHLPTLDAAVPSTPARDLLGSLKGR